MCPEEFERLLADFCCAGLLLLHHQKASYHCGGGGGYGNRQHRQQDATSAEPMWLVCSARPVGVLAYWNSEAVGWCSIAPRENYRALERFRALPRLDDKPVGSVVCFFVDRHVRSQRVTLGLLNAAVEYARSQGATIIEGYPMKPGPRLYTYIGSRSCF